MLVVHRGCASCADINVSAIKLCKLLFGVLFFCHVIGCAAYGVSTTQPDAVFGMFRPPVWWGCELAPFAPDAHGAIQITKNSVWKELGEMEMDSEFLTAVPMALPDFCPTEPALCVRLWFRHIA